MKLKKDPYTYLFPVPVILVTCVDIIGKPNIITIAWAGTVCSDPPTVSISIRPSRYSHKLISESKEFVINIPTTKYLKLADICGTKSGADVDKFELTGFTKEDAAIVKAPLIKECPVNIECIVKDIKKIGAHDMFLGQIVKVHIDEDIIDASGRIDFSKADPMVYNDRQYWSIGSFLGTYGFSLKGEKL